MSMACDTVEAGSGFLASTLGNLDCQGRTIGAYGYGALADPTSLVSVMATSVLAAFIALFGMRLIIGRHVSTTTLIEDALRVGIFLALVTSWPAWRIVGYDLVLEGPGEVASIIGDAAGLPGQSTDLEAALQKADDALVRLTSLGTGRLTGGIAAGADQGDAASGIALADHTGFGLGRVAFLTSKIGAFGLLRLSAGILLALAPLMAGLLLFAGTRGLFLGWLRSLGFCAIGSLVFQLICGAELSILYPWTQQALEQRQANIFTPSAPTELLVLALAFGIAVLGALALVARLTFFVSFPEWLGGTRSLERPSSSHEAHRWTAEPLRQSAEVNRAHRIAGAVAMQMRDEDARAYGLRDRGEGVGAGAKIPSAVATPHEKSAALRQGSRGPTGRVSNAGRKRDGA